MRLSASKLERATECSASMALPVVQSAPGQPAERGTIIHSFTENTVKGLLENKTLDDAVSTALARVPEAYRDTCEGIDFSFLAGLTDLRPEQGVAYDPATGKVRDLGTGLAHGQGDASELEIAGIADLASNSETVTVLDYKTGRGFVPPAKRNRQLGFLAMALCKLWRRKHAIVALLHVREDGTIYQDKHQLDSFDLARIEAEVKTTWANRQEELNALTQGKALRYKTGEWCNYCESFNYCAASTALVRLMAKEPASLEQAVTELLASGDGTAAYQRYKEADRVMKAVRAALTKWAVKNPIELGDGRVYGELVYPKDEIIGSVAYSTITELTDVTPEVKITKKAIAAVAKAVAGKRKEAGIKTTQKATNEELMNAISQAGGLVSVMTRTVKEHTPGEIPDDE